MSQITVTIPALTSFDGRIVYAQAQRTTYGSIAELAADVDYRARVGYHPLVMSKGVRRQLDRYLARDVKREAYVEREHERRMATYDRERAQIVRRNAQRNAAAMRKVAGA